ncbi:MAG: hypothetical protein KAJ07_04730 [Planctomycetes bacterium]|nr:hypothetical protein [Planctomycetota bacterium]
MTTNTELKNELQNMRLDQANAMHALELKIIGKLETMASASAESTKDIELKMVSIEGVAVDNTGEINRLRGSSTFYDLLLAVVTILSAILLGI